MLADLLRFKKYLAKFVGHKQCYLCHQTSQELICHYCMRDAVLPLFPSPGHNLLEYKKVSEHLLNPHYENLQALGAYDGILIGLINQLKFSSKPIAADVLIKLFTHYLAQRLIFFNLVPDAFVPIPLSNYRYVSRQYNQSRLLAQNLADYFSCDCADVLERVKHTKPQSQLNQEQRKANLSDAFIVQQSFEYERVVLVDDVVTTGATINEACKMLRQYKPELSIGVWVMAVTMAPEEMAPEEVAPEEIALSTNSSNVCKF